MNLDLKKTPQSAGIISLRTARRICMLLTGAVCVSAACTVGFGKSRQPAGDAALPDGMTDGSLVPDADDPSDGDPGPHCGNSIAEAGELCDGEDLNGMTCLDFEYDGGELRCTAQCAFDLSLCTEPGSCVGQCDPCTDFDDTDSCTGQHGCTWDPQPACTGDCTVCSTLSDETACGAVAGCSWEPAGPCSGTCIPCANHDAQSCDSYQGCSPTAGSCTGTPDSCGGLSQSDCTTVGCDWTTGYCSGGYLDCSDITMPASCNATGTGCSWDYQNLQCDPAGTPVECNVFANAPDCNATSDMCSWVSEACSGTPDACGGRDDTACTHGCNWQAGQCDGSCKPCQNYTFEQHCTAAGCNWDPAGPCEGTCTQCTTLTDQQVCEGNGCRWQPIPACAGECSACADLQNEDACGGQAGCTWVQN
jgi:hypothetical protein